MSHNATNWAIQQRGLKPTTRIVLWHLCDRHNPDFGCFPSQHQLAHDCEISRSTLNVHLDRLEAAGLIRRVTCFNPVTQRRRPTQYFLGFEAPPSPEGKGPGPESGDGLEGLETPPVPAGECRPKTADAAMPCPDVGHGAMSDSCAEPCPEKGQSRVRNLDNNPVREPLSKPVKEEEDAQAREADFDEFFGKLLEALGFTPQSALPGWWQGWPAREHVRRWRDDLRLCESKILEVAAATRRDHPAPPDGPKALDRAMERAASPITSKAGKRRKRVATPPPTEDELAGFYADMVNADGYLPPSAISSRVCEMLLARGLVTPERLRMRGVL